MDELNPQIRAIRLYKNAIAVNDHRRIGYRIKKYIEVEFFSGEIRQLNADSGFDMTDCDYINLADKGTFVKYIFESQ